MNLKSAIELYPFSLAAIVAGNDNLDREITSINIVEVPTVARWMKGGEMLFTSGFAFQGNIATACQIISDLSSKNVAALAIKPGIYMSSIPEELIEFANQIHFPILQIPEDKPYDIFMQPLLENLINEQIDLLKKAENIHNMLLKPLIDDTGLAGVCEVLYSLTKLPALLFDADFITLANIGLSTEEKEIFESILLEQASQPRSEFFSNLPSHRVTSIISAKDDLDFRILPIDVNRSQSAYLCIFNRRELTNYDNAVLNTADTIISLILQQHRALLIKEWQLKGECLDELIWQSDIDEISVLHRAEYLNFDLRKPFMVTIFDISANPALTIHSVSDKVQLLKTIQDKIHNRINLAISHMMMQNRGNTVVVLFSLPNDYEKNKSFKTIESITTFLANEYPQMRCIAGIGKTYSGVPNVKASFKEAKTALRCGKGLKNGGNIFHFANMGEFRFLCELQESQAMLDFYKEHMSGLIAYDAKKNTELVNTLKAYFDNQCNIRKTAEALFTHKNTIVYRLHRIEKLTNHNLSDSESIFQLQLCMKIKAILQQSDEIDE